MSEWRIIEGDCLAVLAGMEAGSVDAVVTDPPAGISFMGRDWDGDRGGRDAWVAWLASVLGECRRVLKPGGHALVWALPRTSHWTGMACEDAGFEIRDVCHHIFAQGFPKSHNVGLAMDKRAGAEREVVGTYKHPDGANRQRGSGPRLEGMVGEFGYSGRLDVTAPATDLARQWDGWGTALKPAVEHWILCRKPLIGTVAANVAAHGVGALNIAACRLSAPGREFGNGTGRNGGQFGGGGTTSHERGAWQPTAGRWPANLCLSHAPDCRPVGVRRVKGAGWSDADKRTTMMRGNVAPQASNGHHYGDADGMETVEAWECVEGCPVRELDGQSGALGNAHRPNRVVGQKVKQGPVAFGKINQLSATYADTGGASRFFFVAKAGRAEREAGLAGLERRPVGNFDDDGHRQPGERKNNHTAPHPATNHHPTVKPLALMRHLVRLVTPPGGLVLDPFAGSGSTGVACLHEGMRFVGIEREPEYAAIARLRLAHAGLQARLPVREGVTA